MIEKIKYKLNKISKFINRVNQLISIYLYKNRNKEFEEIIKQNRIMDFEQVRLVNSIKKIELSS